MTEFGMVTQVRGRSIRGQTSPHPRRRRRGPSVPQIFGTLIPTPKTARPTATKFGTYGITCGGCSVF